MSQEIIAVLEYIGEKLGIAIDWTAENVMPQVMAILGRYRILEIVESCIWLIVALAATIVFVSIWKKCLKAHKACEEHGESNFWWGYRSYSGRAEMEGTFGLIMATVFGGIPIVAAFISHTYNLLYWILVPELKFLELFKDIMAS